METLCSSTVLTTLTFATQQRPGRCTKPGIYAKLRDKITPKQLDSWPVHSDWVDNPGHPFNQDSWDGCWWWGELWGYSHTFKLPTNFFFIWHNIQHLSQVFLFNPWWKDQLVNSICCVWDADLLTSLTSKTSLIILLSQKDQVKGTTALVCN